VIGSICGDIIGSVYEFHNTHDKDFPFFAKKTTFTDDSVLTVATADVLLDGSTDYAKYYLDYAQAFPNRGYGGHFLKMVKSGKIVPYNSFGNGSAMRVSPIGWAFDSLPVTIDEAKKSAECSHNHDEGIRGAQAIAASIY